MDWFLYAVLASAFCSLLWIAASKSAILCNLASMSLLVCSVVMKRVRLSVKLKWYKWVSPYKPVATDANNPANKPAPNVVMKRPVAKLALHKVHDS